MVNKSQDVEYPVAVGHAPTSQPLSLRFGLIVVVAALGASFVLRTAVSAGASAAALAQSAGSGGWSGLGIALAGVTLAFVGGYGIAVVVALTMTRRRAGGRRFAVHFAAVYLACLLVDGASRWFGLFTVELGDNFVETSGFVTVALPFTLPLVLSGLIRWRTVALVSLIGVALAIAAVVVQTQLAAAEQSDRNSAYTGPVFAPSTSPASPVDGYSLEYVKLPSEYDDYEGAVGVSFTYRKPAPDGFDDYFYIELSADNSAMYCGDAGDDCAEVGPALGSMVYAESPIDYLVEVDGGMVAVRGDLDGDQVLAVLNDLHVASLDELVDLTTE